MAILYHTPAFFRHLFCLGSVVLYKKRPCYGGLEKWFQTAGLTLNLFYAEFTYTRAIFFLSIAFEFVVEVYFILANSILTPSNSFVQFGPA